MRIHKVDIEDIVFKKCVYSKTMYDSILRIGLSFAVKVIYQDGKYYCQDGHKRLSAISDMVKSDPSCKRRKINIIILNNGDSRSNDCWRARNTH